MRKNGLSGALKLFVVVGLVAMATAACGTDEAGDSNTAMTGKYPVIELQAGGGVCQIAGGDKLINCKHQFDQGQVEPGEPINWTVFVKNTGERDLKIKAVELQDYQTGEGVEETEPAIVFDTPTEFKDAMNAKKDFYVARSGEGTDEKPEELAIRVVFTRPSDDKERSAKLVILTDASNSPKVEVLLSTAKGFPKIIVSPPFINFGQVGMGEVREEKINILNTGANDLVLKGFTLTGSHFYTLIVEGAEFPVANVPAEGISFEEPPVVVAGNVTYFKVRFEPQNAEPSIATLKIFSNDPEQEKGVEVKISGNESVPCIAVNPEKVNFGGKKFGELASVPVTIKACGEAQLELYNIYIKDGSSTDFAVDTTPLGAIPSLEAPVVVKVGGEVKVDVTFIPDAVNPIGEDGSMIMDTGVLVIDNNSFQKSKEVEIMGAGVDVVCPTAIIKVAEGEEVIPQTLLHLYGDESYAANGTIQKWEWSVEQPNGSQSVFVPSAQFPNPTFEANVAGVYKFYLTVYDQTNTPSCFPAEYEVVVIPDEAIHIELLWHTPEDPDETDTGPEAGSDLDLHFLHPWAAGPDLDGDGNPDGWFDIPFDAFWFNAHPNWGSYDPAINDDPGLDRDDTDGAGPENINLDIPENVTYRVGIHYWNDHGYGASYATVRVYIYAQLVFEVQDTMLIDSDMWEVCTVEWPSGKVQVMTDAYGNPKITPDYHNPYFFQ